jgi:ligand-binding sensor domain-containing protein/signal transduction histidine kinase
MRAKQLWLVLVLICLIPLVSVAQIISPQRLFGRYQQFAWQDQHGLPQNGISEIVKTPDGYLWLAIAEGVVRFDGVRFTAFDTENTPEIRSNNVQSLLVSRDGTLWIGTHGGGLSRYKDRKFDILSTEHGLSSPFVRAIFEDKSGNIWVGTDGGGLNLLRDGKFTVFKTEDGLPSNRVTVINQDFEGNLLIGTVNGLARFQDGRISAFADNEGLDKTEVREIFPDSAGSIWISSINGVRRIRDGIFETIRELEGHVIASIAEEHDGTLWFGVDAGGLFRLKDGAFAHATTKSGLINDEIQAVFPDQTGNVWLGTNGGGLVELKAGRFNTLTTSEGLADNIVTSVFMDQVGAIWMGTATGLSRFKDGKFTTMTLPDGTPLARSNRIMQDSNGNLWLSSTVGPKKLKYVEGSSRLAVLEANELNADSLIVREDRKGNFWFAPRANGLRRIEPNGTQTNFRKEDGLADDIVNTLFEDSRGTMWVGTRNGINSFNDGTLKAFSEKDGWTGKHVISFHEDKNGNIWIGTHGDGLFVFRNGKFSVITSKNGLYDNLAFQILEDDKQNLWMSGNKGIYRASIGELLDFVDGRRTSVNSFSYGSVDGMLSRECNGANPAGVKDRDGKLWFPTIKGVVVVDPTVSDQEIPFVNIEKVLVDNQTIPDIERIEMGPDQTDLEIQFSAISWNRPSQIRFKYQLVGLDEDWVDSGTRRTAYYPHITPGEYTFRVIADNGEGVWNLEGRSLVVKVSPPFYQTWWFYLLCVLVAFLIIRAIYRYRIAQLNKLHEAHEAFTQKLFESQEAFSRQLIESQELERKRIAVELHDSIGQSLIVIRNRALMGLSSADKQDRLIAQVEEISESAAETITEVRRISQNLHPYQIEHLGLTTAIETMIENADAVSEISFETDIDDVDRILAKESEINLYRILQESINNILKHSQAVKAKIAIKRGNEFLSISVEDDGKGFNPEDLTFRSVGLGLTGIRERAKILGANHEIHSVEGKGTTVSLRIELPQNHEG